MGGVGLDQIPEKYRPVVGDPWVIRQVFESTRFAWAWVLVRAWVGLAWFDAGWSKATSPAWTVSGEALKRFWVKAASVQVGPEIGYSWYRSFIIMLLEGEHHRWFAKLITFAELSIGIALVVGALTGFASFSGGFLNFNYMMAGSASINPVLYTLTIALLLAWKVAGHIGLDRWLLPLMGTPWGRPTEKLRSLKS